MKLFEFVQKIYKHLGVVPPLQHNQNCPINSKMLIIFLPMALYCVSSVVFLLFKAKTSQEFTDASFWTTAAYISIFTFIHTVSKMPMTFDLVGKFEEIIRKSTYLKQKIQHSIARIPLFTLHVNASVFTTISTPQNAMIQCKWRNIQKWMRKSSIYPNCIIRFLLNISSWLVFYHIHA